MSVQRQITLRGATGKHRMAVFENRDFIVVPVVALVEGVIRAMNSTAPEFVPAETFSAAYQGWDGRPVMHNHPVNSDGKPISANSPETLEAFCFGRVFNTAVSNKKLTMEGWIDVAKASALGGEVQKTVDRILDDKPVEVSVGVWVVAEERSGKYNDKEYSYVWQELVPDHLAFLEQGHTGACSNEMGCGVRAAAVHTLTAEGIESMAEPVTKRSLRERLLGILPLRSNAKGYSDNDIREALREAVRNSEPLPTYIESVYESDGYFIYCTMSVDPQSYEEHYYKRSFTLDKASGAITLGFDRAEVEPVVKFEPLSAEEGQPRAACACQHTAAAATQTPSEKDNVMTRQERIQALMLNDKCQIKEQKSLEALSDEGLAALEETVGATPTPVPPTVPSTPPTTAPTSTPSVPSTPAAPKTAQQWLEEAPADVQAELTTLRSIAARVEAQDAAKKSALVASLKSAQKTYDEAELNAMSIEQLEKTSALLKIETPRTANDIDFSARSPRAASTERDFTPPDPYAAKK